MSGFSTTGASVLTDIDGISRSMAMWRQFSQWIGGVGIIVLFLAVLPGCASAAGRRCSDGDGRAEARARGHHPADRPAVPRPLRRPHRGEALILAVLGWTGVDPEMDPFDAVAHALTTVATAGFSPEGRSVEPSPPRRSG
jgi:trk system potassium uptake protein TrkH